jgi:hypothetical protein
MHPPIAPFSGSGTSRHMLFSAACITIMYGFRFSAHTEMQIDFHDLLVAISVLVGFQVTLFIWRIDREVNKKPEQRSWLPPSDWLGGLSMLCFVVGGLLLPIIEVVDIQTPKKLFGLGALLRGRRRAFLPSWRRVASES